MKRVSILFLLTFVSKSALKACEVCKEKQPEALANITHGSGPNSNLDYIIIWSAVVIVGLTLFYSIKHLIKPESGKPHHIKNIVTNEYF